MTDELRQIIEKEADKHAYDDDKPMTFSERILAYQAFIAGAEYLLKISSLEKPTNKDKKDL